MYVHSWNGVHLRHPNLNSNVTAHQTF